MFDEMLFYLGFDDGQLPVAGDKYAHIVTEQR